MIRSPAGFDGADRIKRYLDYYQPSYGVMMLSAGQFSPAALFASGEQGAWYDPSDFSTLFQNSAGTTPVTAVEQPVGLILDKSGRGNHASQSTSASRPVLSARVNLLTRTEEFDNAAWTKVNCTFLTGIITTTSTSDGLNQAITSYGSNASHSFTWRVSSGTATWLRVVVYQTSASANRVTAWFNVATGATGTAANGGTATGAALSVKTVSSGVYDITLSGAVNNGATGVTAQISTANSDASTTGVSGVTYGVQFADLRPSNAGVGLPAYQRVTTATDYDTTGFPLYLRFDGTDDSMATSTINPGSVDKAQVFAGVRKLSDAAQGVLAEWSATIASNNGTFLLAAPDGATATFGFDSKGTVQVDAVASSLTAPLTRVVTGLGDISGDTATIRINGVQADQDTGDQGTGNYLSYPLYIGSRAGTSLPFAGRLYSLIVRFSATNLPDATIAQTETWVNGKTKAY